MFLVVASRKGFATQGVAYAYPMKVTTSLRQALDWPREPSPPPLAMPSSLPAAHQLASRRHVQGRQHLSAVVNFWLAKANLSHEQLGSIADWAMSEKGWLSSPQISHLRNGSVVKPSHKNLDALGGANEAIWRWQQRGPEECMRRYGPHSAYRIQDALGLPRFRGQVDRSHAMTLRLSIDDQPNQDQAPVHASAEAGGY